MSERMRIQRKKATNEHGDIQRSVRETIASEGQPLDPRTRATMEPRFGHDFSQVRIHTDTRAAESADALGANAYTTGPNLVFGAGQYAPESSGGQRLIAHELAHVVQQASGPVSGSIKEDGLSISHPSDRFEHEADASADRVMAGQTVAGPSGAHATAGGAMAIQRQADDEAEEAAPAVDEAAAHQDEKDSE